MQGSDPFDYFASPAVAADVPVATPSASSAARNALVIRATPAGSSSQGRCPAAGISDAVERLWLLTTVESFLTAIDRLGRTPERYEAWLGDLLEAEILGSERS